MQIGNNRPSGSQPNERNKQGQLDPDLTKGNREGMEKTTRVSSARVQEASQSRSDPKSIEVRQSKDTFERSKPQDDPGMDVAERIKNARSQHMATRVGNARKQEAGQIDAEANKGQRIANARAQHAEANPETKTRADIGTGDSGKAERIANARAQHAEVNPETKTRSDVGRDVMADKAERISNARAEQPMTRNEAARSQDMDAQQAMRIQNARSQFRASNVDLPGVGGRPETAAARTERVEGLREAHQAGEIHTPERAREAAGRLLGSE